jgi:5-methylcytosine-specific restriction endonuclease McrA
VVLKSCWCGRIIEQPGRSRCSVHQREDDQRRNQRRAESGRSSYHWIKLREQAIARAGNRCQNPACGVELTKHTATVHLDPKLKGNHRHATLNNVTVLCRSCHGSVDAPRAAMSRR